MEEQFIRDRLTRLREEKQVSERKMSLDYATATAISAVSHPAGRSRPWENSSTSANI